MRLNLLLQELGAGYCILHGWQHPELPSDLDIVVLPETLYTLEKTLLQPSRGKLVQLLQHESSCYYFVLAMPDSSGKRFVPIDAATDYRRNGRIFFSAEELLDGHRQWNGLWVASPEVEFKYLLVKKVLKGTMPQAQKERFKHLVQELGNGAETLVVKLLGAKWGWQVVSLICADDWCVFVSNLARLKRMLLWQRVKQDPLNPLRYWLPELRRLWLRWRYPTGLWVAVLGPDGAGKSTLIPHLQSQLSGAFRRFGVFHLKPGLLGKKSTSTPVIDPYGKPPRALVTSLLKIPYYLLDYALGYLFKTRPKLVRTALVLFDRYYDDLLVDPRRYRYRGPQWLARFARKFVPRPDVFLILDVTEEQLLARKQEILREELIRQRSSYRKLAGELPNAVLLDGSLPPNEVAQHACDVVLDYLHERYLKRRHIWFRYGCSDHLSWLTSVLNAPPKQAQQSITFRKLLLPDGRGYLLPAHPRRAMLQALTLYNAYGKKARIAKFLLGAGIGAGFGHLLLPKWDLASNDALWEHLRSIFQRADLTFAVSLGTPGAHRKPVIQVSTQDGKILGYAKVGWNERTNALVCTESKILKELSKFSLGFEIPEVIYASEWQGRFLCVQAAMDTKAVPAPRTLEKEYLSVLEEFASLYTRRQQLAQSSFRARLEERIEQVQNTYFRHLLQNGLSVVKAALNHRLMPSHFCHGDFTPWNTYRMGERLFLYDWEYADREAPAGYDLFHFLVRTLWLIQRQTPGEIYRTVMSKMEEPKVRAYWEQVGAGPDIARTLFLMYLLDWLAFYATEEPGNFRESRHLAMLVNLCIHEEVRGCNA